MATNNGTTGASTNTALRRYTVDYQRLNHFFHEYISHLSEGRLTVRAAEGSNPAAAPVGDTVQLDLRVVGIDPAGEEPVYARVVEVGAEGMQVELRFDSEAQRMAFHSSIERMIQRSLGAPLYNQLLAAARRG